MSAADCGAIFAHDPHGFLDSTGLARACDGSTTKRPEPRP